jgi:hypothetical protein
MTNMPEESITNTETAETAPSSTRDFSQDPATPAELETWTEEYRVAPDSEPTMFAEPTPDLSVFENDLTQGSGVPKGQELAPVDTETLPEPAQEDELESSTGDEDDIEDADFTEEQEPPTPENISGMATLEQDTETELPHETAAEELHQTQAPERVGGYTEHSIHVGGGEPIIYRTERDSDLIERLIALIQQARAAGETVRVIQLEQELTEARAAQAAPETVVGSGGEQPPVDGTESQTAGGGPENEPVNEAGEETAIEGEYIPAGEKSSVETQPRLEHDAVPALEYQPTTPETRAP